MLSSFEALAFRPRASIPFELRSEGAASRIAFQWRSGQSQVRYPCFDRAEGFLVSRSFGREAALTGQNSPRENFPRSGTFSRQVFSTRPHTTRASASLPGRILALSRHRSRRRGARLRAPQLSKKFLLRTTADTSGSRGPRRSQKTPRRPHP